MWVSAFQCSDQPVTHALLDRPVLLAGARAFEKLSGAITVRTALNLSASDKTLVFMVPEATASTVLHISSALLVGNHAHSNGVDWLPEIEVRPLFKGDLLIVTPFVSKIKSEFENLSIGNQRLRKLWDVVPLSRYTSTQSQMPRVFLANPGWAMKMTDGRKFGAVIIDATHPRTLSRFSDLLKAAIGYSAIRISVTPPLSQPTLTACGYPDRVVVWLWDPQAKADAERVLGKEMPKPPVFGTKTLWVCEDDAEAANALENLYQHLIGILKQTEGRSYPGFQMVWSVYMRLRNLVVPLTEMEEAASGTWMGTLRRRIESLSSIQGYGNPVWDSTWPDLCETVRATYTIFLKRQETAKFWALATRLEQLLKDRVTVVRVVVGSETELELVRRHLVDIIDGVDDNIAEGRVDIVTPSQEARIVADGFVCHTLLLGPRTSASRHLDLFPSEPVEVFVYPFEAAIEKAAHQRLLTMAAELGSSASRIEFLAKLGLRLPASAVEKDSPSARWPDLQVLGAESGRSVELTRYSETASLLDLSALLTQQYSDKDLHVSSPTDDNLEPSPETGEVVEVTFRQGITLRFPAKHNIDVYFTATGQVERKPVGELQPGWHVISFVDGQYDSLFHRLTEVVEAQLPLKERIAMELWVAAKQKLNEKYPNKRQLHERLRTQGLDATYEALLTWLREGDEGVLAPQHFAEFAELAKASGVYPSEKLIKQTFRSIQKARGRNRVSGRHLCAFLRAVVSGEGYDDALESARFLDAGLGDVLAAVEVLDVASIKAIPRSP